MPLLHPHQGDDPFGVSARVAPPPPPPPPPAAFPLSSTTFLSLVGDKHVEAMIPPLSQSFRTDGRMDVFSSGRLEFHVMWVRVGMYRAVRICCHARAAFAVMYLPAYPLRKAISVSNLQENMHRTRWSFSMQRKGRAECKTEADDWKGGKGRGVFCFASSLLASWPATHTCSPAHGRSAQERAARSFAKVKNEGMEES